MSSFAFFCVSSSRPLFYSSPLNNFIFFHTQGKDGRDGRDGINGNGMKVKILKRNKAFSSLPQGSGVKRTLTLCKTIESIETFLNSCAKLVVSACARALHFEILCNFVTRAFRIMSSGREWLLWHTDRKTWRYFEKS